MPRYSKVSQDRLSSCHPDLQQVFREVIQHTDCSILCGHRTREEQMQAYVDGNSTLPWPQSKHNVRPSLAVDAAPYLPGKGVSWEPRQCAYFAGQVMTIARLLGVKLRWGGDWDRDGDVTDQSFNDLVHFELEV